MRIGRCLIGLIMLGLVVPPALAVHPLADRDATEWMGPQAVDAGATGIGKRVPDMRLEQVFGGSVSLHAAAGDRGLVISVRDPECPVSHAYGPRLARFAREYHPRGFNFGSSTFHVDSRIFPAGLAIR